MLTDTKNLSGLEQKQSSDIDFYCFINEKITMMDPYSLQRQMRRNFELLGLFKDGQWTLPTLNALNPDAFLFDCQNQELEKQWELFIQRIQSNPIILALIHEVQSNETLKKELQENLNRYTSEQWELMFTCSMMLERISTLIVEHPLILQEVVEHLHKQPNPRFDPKTSDIKIHLFKLVKRISVKRVMDKSIKAIVHKRGKIYNISSVSLPINILEAVWTERMRKEGSKANAAAGVVLARNRSGLKVEDHRTAAGPTRLSADEKKLLLFPPLSKEWMDLYVSWNLCFVATFKKGPLMAQKLFLPLLYEDRLGHEFMYKRAIALYIHLRFLDFRQIRLNRVKDSIEQWEAPNLIAAWGKINLQFAKAYQLKVDELKKVS